MSIQKWSDDIVVVELADDPQYTDEMATLAEMLSGHPANVVLNCASLGYINSSNIARLLRLRKQLLGAARRLVLCAVADQVWGVFLVTGLDKIFDLTDDVATALATLQLSGKRQGGGQG